MIRAAPFHRTFRATPPAGTRQLLEELGAKKFAQWMLKQKRLLITDTTMRDAHQSLLATRVRTVDMLAASPISWRIICPDLFSLEMWGGATFDMALRFLQEDPWERLSTLRKAIPNVLFQMLLRASERGGVYELSGQRGAGIHAKLRRRRGSMFSASSIRLNWTANMKVAMEAVLETDAICEAAICYTGDILDPKRDKYSLKYYVKLAKELERMGTHILAIKDMAGLLQAVRGVQAGEGAAGGGRAADPFSYA